VLVFVKAVLHFMFYGISFPVKYICLRLGIMLMLTRQLVIVGSHLYKDSHSV